jgi:hypothetical protein
MAALERLWRDAAIRSVDPPAAELRHASAQAQVWRDVAGLPTDALHERIARLVDSHRLAIARGDIEWLRELDATWRAAPAMIEDLRVLRAAGEIGLGLGTSGWTGPEIELLVEESFLVPGVPAEDAWRALAEGDRDRARGHVRKAQAERVPLLRSVRAEVWPGFVLDIELRALRALLNRA